MQVSQISLNPKIKLDYRVRGYAADGYARIKGIGAIVTTFGVGELSLTNAIAGSRAENVPVVHIVGTPSTKSQREEMILHHTFGNGDFGVFREVAERRTVAQADLCDPSTATSEIDRVLRDCWVQSPLVYIQLPTDMADKPVDGTALDTPLDLSYPTNSREEEAHIVRLVLQRLYNAVRPSPSHRWRRTTDSSQIPTHICDVRAFANISDS